MKRLMDILAASFGLLLLAPLLLTIALIVRLDSKGPALFRQTRVGLRGRQFEILKFRSMIATDSIDCSMRQITVTADARITRVGTWLRRTKLDELPQLVNVLRGEMSVVGPRPEVPKYVALYPDDVRAEILSIRPGITDEAAIEFRDEGDILSRSDDPERTYVEEILPRKIQHYRRYVQTRSLVGDAGIVLRTFARILRPTHLDRG